MAGRDRMTIEEVVGQVLTTRERSVMGAMKEPYDVLFAVKLTVDLRTASRSRFRVRCLSVTTRTA